MSREPSRVSFCLISRNPNVDGQMWRLFRPSCAISYDGSACNVYGFIGSFVLRMVWGIYGFMRDSYFSFVLQCYVGRRPQVYNPFFFHQKDHYIRRKHLSSRQKKKFFITGILSKEESRNNGLSHTPRLNPKSPNCRSSP